MPYKLRKLWIAIFSDTQLGTGLFCKKCSYKLWPVSLPKIAIAIAPDGKNYAIYSWRTGPKNLREIGVPTPQKNSERQVCEPGYFTH